MEIGLFFNNFQDGLKNSLGKFKKACSHSICSSTSKWKWFKQIATQATKTFSFMTSQVENHSEIINVLALESYYQKLTCAEKKQNPLGIVQTSTVIMLELKKVMILKPK